MREAEPFLAPFLQVPFVVVRFFQQRERFVFDDAQPPVGGEVNGAITRGDGVDAIVGKPALTGEVIELPVCHPDRAAGRSDP